MQDLKFHCKCSASDRLRLRHQRFSVTHHCCMVRHCTDQLMTQLDNTKFRWFTKWTFIMVQHIRVLPINNLSSGVTINSHVRHSFNVLGWHGTDSRPHHQGNHFSAKLCQNRPPNQAGFFEKRQKFSKFGICSKKLFSLLNYSKYAFKTVKFEQISQKSFKKQPNGYRGQLHGVISKIFPVVSLRNCALFSFLTFHFCDRDAYTQYFGCILAFLAKAVSQKQAFSAHK